MWLIELLPPEDAVQESRVNIPESCEREALPPYVTVYMVRVQV